MAGEDGETAYNTETASIERFDGGFLVVSKNTGAKTWHPDGMVRMAYWVKETAPVSAHARDTEPPAAP